MIRLLLIFCLLIGVARAQEGDGPVYDPYQLAPTTKFSVGTIATAPNTNINAVSLASQTINTGLRNLIFIQAGQSNWEPIAATAYTPVHGSSIRQMNIYDGALYTIAEPTLGCSYAGAQIGNPSLRVVDSLISANLFDQAVIVCASVGGTAVADWSSGFLQGRLVVALNRITARGIVPGSNVTIIIAWGQGESDNQNGTSQAAYTASLNALIAQTRAAGFNGTWFVADETVLSNVASTTIRAAQAAVVSHGSGVWAGPNADALVGNICGAGGNLACRQADGTHWTDAGSYSVAAAWVTALEAFGAPF